MSSRYPLGVYRFVLSPRWIGLAAAALAAMAVMVLLGNWQWIRYEQRTASNARIDYGAQARPVPLTQILPRPDTVGRAGPAPAPDAEWAAVRATGRYDHARELLVRGRTVNGGVGFEVLTPLILAGGAAVVVDRGWVAAPAADATARPDIAPAPPGQVTVIGRVHLSESRPRPLQRHNGRLEARRVNMAQLAGELPYPVFSAYLLLTVQVPPADPGLTVIPVQTDNAWQSGAYAVQWWLFTVLTGFAYVWAVRREAHPLRPGPRRDRVPGDAIAAPVSV